MSRRFSPPAVLLFLAICATVSVESPALSADENATRKNRYQNTRTETGRIHVGVMGAVKNGGVYHTQAASPTLRELIEGAGGLTPSATGSVSIVRGGRFRLHTHVATGLETRLQPNDLVIVDARRQGTARYAEFSTSKRRRVDRDASSAVEVGLVNLIDRPVVLRLRPQHADLTTLLQLLQQPAEAASHVRILGGVRRSSRRQRSLSKGDVLVFDGKAIRPNRVPALPQSVPLARANPPGKKTQGIVAAEHRSIVGNSRPTGQRGQFNRRRGNNTIQLTQSERPGSAAANPSPFRVLKSEPPPNLRKADAAAAPLKHNPDTASGAMIAPPIPGQTSAAAMSPRADGNAPSSRNGRIGDGPRADDSASDSETSSAHQDLVDRARDEQTQQPEQAISIDTVTLVICIFAAIGVLSAGGLLWSMARKAVNGEQDNADSEEPQRSLLERLLNDELAIEETPCVIPDGLIFFGRPGGRKRDRVEHRHETGDLFRPHFKPRPSTSPQNEPGLAETATAPAENLKPRAVEPIARADQPQPPLRRPKTQAQPSPRGPATSPESEKESAR